MRARPRKGLTLVELAVALVVLGLLIAVASFAVRAVFSNAGNAEATARLERVVTAQQLVSNDYGQFSPYLLDLQGVGSDVALVGNGADPTTAGSALPVVSIGVSDAGSLAAATYSNGACYYAYTPYQVSATGTTYGSFDSTAKQCTAWAGLSRASTGEVPQASFDMTKSLRVTSGF